VSGAEELYRRYRQRVLARAYAATGGDWWLAEDLAAETFARAVRHDGALCGKWLRVVVARLAVDHARSAVRRREVATAELPERAVACGPEETVLRRETAGEVRRAVADLPALQRQVIALRFWSEASLADTARATGRSVGAVKQAQWRAARTLAVRLTEPR
jgi:RNA polymerase sigma factor (sigma-70 family)